MKIHKLAEMFPLMIEEEFNALVESIKTNGLLEPITTYKGEILDGHNRFKACIKAGVKPKFEEFIGSDPFEFVLIKNFDRRNLNESQKALIGSKFTTLKNGQRSCATLHSSSQIAKKFGVSERIIKQAKSIKNENIENAIKEGYLTVNEATTIKDLPEKQIKQALAGIKTGDYKNARQAVRDLKIKARQKKTQSVEASNIWCMDSIEFINKLQDESVDCFITDPPYGIEIHNTRKQEKQYADGKEYAIDLLDNVLKALKPKLTKDAHLYIFSGYTNAYEFKNLIAKYYEVQDNPIIWVKDNHTMCNFSTAYANKHEYIWFAKNGEGRILNGFSSDILNFPRQHDTDHTAEKPVDLLKFLISQSTVEGEIVVDCFVGSGSSAVAAKQLNRNFSGCDAEKHWVETTKGRL